MKIMFEKEIVSLGSSGVVEDITVTHRKRNSKIVEFAEIKSCDPGQECCRYWTEGHRRRS